MTRLDKRLEGEVAEFPILENLVLSRIPARTTDTQTPGYNFVATEARR
jgi:hypothetical protein